SFPTDPAWIPVPSVPAPQPAGLTELLDVTGLVPGLVFQFGLQAIDQGGLRSVPSFTSTVTASNFGLAFAPYGKNFGLDTADMAWGDFDGDQRLDFVVVGASGSTRVTQLYE